MISAEKQRILFIAYERGRGTSAAATSAGVSIGTAAKYFRKYARAGFARDVCSIKRSAPIYCGPLWIG